MVRHAVNWKASVEAVGTSLRDDTARLGCLCLSAGGMSGTTADGQFKAASYGDSDFHSAKTNSIMVEAIFRFYRSQLNGGDSYSFKVEEQRILREQRESREREVLRAAQAQYEAANGAT